MLQQQLGGLAGLTGLSDVIASDDSHQQAGCEEHNNEQVGQRVDELGRNLGVVEQQSAQQEERQGHQTHRVDEINQRIVKGTSIEVSSDATEHDDHAKGSLNKRLVLQEDKHEAEQQTPRHEDQLPPHKLRLITLEETGEAADKGRVIPEVVPLPVSQHCNKQQWQAKHIQQHAHRARSHHTVVRSLVAEEIWIENEKARAVSHGIAKKGAERDDGEGVILDVKEDHVSAYIVVSVAKKVLVPG
mmetsp:Transcript_32004/g.73416  ORF Transcript_32004/g.73416 Transcript_32004/m.73416 type:complete len:244 (-) Transcript_32004:1083-1814(-)